MRLAFPALPVIKIPDLSIRNVLLLIAAGLTLMIALLSARDLYANAQRLHDASELRDASAMSDQLFDATEKVSIERDLALSLLQATDTDTIASLEPQLLEGRRLADASVARTLAALNRFQAPELTVLRRNLSERYAQIRAMRAQIDSALSLPLRRRDVSLRAHWEQVTSQLMADADSLWTSFIRPYTHIDAVVTQQLLYRHFLQVITDYTGRERSIIGQILSENADPSLDQTTRLLRGQGVLELSWQSSRRLAEQSGLYSAVAAYFTDAESHFATVHDMSREMFYVPGAHHGGVYPMGADLWFELAGQALDSLASLRDASRTAIRAHLNQTIASIQGSIVTQIAISLVALALCALSFWVIIARAIRPIERIVDALMRATRGEIVDFAPRGRHDDEIGKLTDVLQAFQRNVEAIRSGAAELDKSARALALEVGVRRAAEEKTQDQLERLALLHRISRAIGERQDLRSIFSVAVGNVEDRLPADFACLCLFDPADRTLEVAQVGAKSAPLAEVLAMNLHARIELDENGLSKCVNGTLVYEPDLSDAAFPFPQRLARAGLGSFVASPLQVESIVFGALIVARTAPQAFSSGECEFLRQLSEHVALASHQSQLHTALQQAYDDLRQTQEAVIQQERLRSLGQMASGIAHDINNALTPVALYTDSLLHSEPNLTPAGRGKLEIIQRAIDDAAQTIARMGEFYRKRDTQLNLTPVDANLVLQQVLDLTQARWRDMPQQRGDVFEMKTELAEGLPAILGVEGELREALTNLVFNAVDAMPSGGTITLRTRVDTFGSGEAVDIEVADSGIGMDEATQRRCLEPFFTTKGERGTGLGLAMVYGAVQRHGAQMKIESAPGQGTLVRLTFTTTAPAVGAGDPRLSQGPRARLRILVVDDDPILLRSLREVLEADGHQVIAAPGGQAGVGAFEGAQAEGHIFDAVITDLGMPGFDGARVASAIKNASPTTPVILLTGWGERLKAEEEVPAHVDCVLSKPPKLRDLRTALEQCCGVASELKRA
jgi:signal transduction histidine kinase/ActR/RegA family two-component response regulator